MEIVVLWTYNGTNVMQREDITYSPPFLNHILIISNTGLGDSGVYTCRISESDIETISVNVVPGIRYVVCKPKCSVGS